MRHAIETVHIASEEHGRRRGGDERVFAVAPGLGGEEGVRGGRGELVLDVLRGISGVCARRPRREQFEWPAQGGLQGGAQAGRIRGVQPVTGVAERRWRRRKGCQYM